MSQSEQNRKNSEIESKFPVPDLSTTLERLKSLNAESGMQIYPPKKT